MRHIQQQVRRAKRQLLVNQMIHSITWATFAALVVALVAIAIPKIWPLDLPLGANWSLAWIVGALVVGVVGGVFWAIWRRQSDLQAAIEIDLRYGLKERVSSAVSLGDEQRHTEVGSALLEDAERRVARIDVTARFRPQVSWHPLLPVLTGVVAFLVASFIHDAVDDVTAANNLADRDARQVRNSVQKLKQRLNQPKKRAAATGLKDTEQIITKLKRAVDELSKGDANRKKALVKLNNLSKELRDRRQQVESVKKTRDMLSKLQTAQRGPAERIAKALKNGDMDKAMDELKKLSDKLRSGKLTAEEKKQLAAQIEKMREELEKMAGARQELVQRQEELKRQIDQLKKEGKLAEAGQLQQKVDQLQNKIDALDRQQPQLNKLQQLASKLGQCAKCVKDGNGQEAADQLDQLAGDLQQMQDELNDLETIDQVMQEIADAKNAMNCEQCGGAGCEACQGQGMMMGQSGGGGKNNGPPGFGLGAGRGQGERPEEKTDTGSYRTRVAGNPQKGEAVRVGDADGPNIAGQTRAQIQEEIASSFSEDPSPLVQQKLPRREREQTREYFELLRKGE